MGSLFDSFKYESGGATTLANSVCFFLKEQIAFGRIKGGERLPTMNEISKATGLSFYQARNVVERLVREGYARSRPHEGTFVLSRGKSVLRGRVLITYPDVDICRYYPTQLFDTINRRLTAAGYAVAANSFPFGAGGSLSQLKSELLRAYDLVIACRATSRVQRCFAESGINHIFAYGDKPRVHDGSPWIRLSSREVLGQFADHCKRAGVKNVVQVRFESDEFFDAGLALAARGVDSSWMTISRPEGGRSRFEGIVHCACEIFQTLPRDRFPDLLLFWNAFVAQGALMAFLDRGIRIPEDVKMVSLSDTGFGPVYVQPMTRIECDPVDAGEKISDFALAVLAKGRIPPPPVIEPQYVFGATFPF